MSEKIHGKETYKYREAIKMFKKNTGLSKKELVKLIEEGKLVPFIKHPVTGNFTRYRVFKIHNDGTIDGEFEH